MGPAAKEAVPVLMHALKDGDDTVRSEAAQALRMIEGR
jgi:HEAT repeat protein